MSDDTQRQYREVQAHFRLPSVALVGKDVHVVRAIQALNAIDAKPFTLVFAGGTALARAHKLVKRMSEDVDFKVVPLPAAPVSASGLRKQLGTLRDRVTASSREAGFGEVGDPRSKNGNRYSLWQRNHTLLSRSDLDRESRALATERVAESRRILDGLDRDHDPTPS